MKKPVCGSLAMLLCVFQLFVCLELVYAQRIGTAVPNEALPEVVKRVQNSVVNIQTDRSFNVGYWRYDSFISQFFEDFLEEKNVAEQKVKCKSEGTGVIIDPSGLILTNEHVIADAQNIKVILNDNKTLIAKVIGKNKKEDLALLQIESKATFPAIIQGNSDAVSAGEDVFAIGTPYGYSQTVTRGIVSATNRQLKDGDKVLFDNLIQTDAAINPGNSGGPLLNSKGEMVGIVRMGDWRAQNINFAIPMNKIQILLSELKTAKRFDLALQKFKEEFGFLPKESKDSDGHEYVSIAEVTPRSKAAKMGLQAEDRLQKFEKLVIDHVEQLLEEAAKVYSGQRVYFEFSRPKRTFFTYIEVAK